MNLALLLGGFVALVVWLWGIQALALRASGIRQVFMLPFRYPEGLPRVRIAMKLALFTGLLALLVLYPWAIGLDAWEYHRSRFALTHWSVFVRAWALVLFMLALALGVQIRAGWVRTQQRHSTAKLVFKIAKAVLIPLPLTLLEEPLFRGLILDQLLESLPGSKLGVACAIVVSAGVFAATHFLRPQKHGVIAAIGLFYTGLVLGCAYVISGRNYWLPIAIHSAGVMFIQATRPITAYEGPAWLIGRSTYPIAGVTSMLAVSLAVAIASIPLLG